MVAGDLSPRLRALLGLLALVTVASAAWPVYRAFLPVEIGYNESWNAYHADTAVRGGHLYPPPDSLVTNNYPPLSFYLTGAAGAVLGDTILAGRLLSLAGIALLGWGIGRLVRRLGGSPAAGWAGGLTFVATQCRFFSGYAGMNDPQLFAQAVMLHAFLAFLAAVERDRGYFPPLLAMVAAGFLKHNLVALPVVAFAWLGLQRPARAAQWGVVAVLLAGGGLAACRAAYGPDFTTNLLSPREYRVGLMLGYLGRLQFLAVGLAVWAYVGVVRRHDPSVRLVNLLVAVSFVSFAVQKGGEGVGPNALFELSVAAAVAVGVAFAQAPHLPLLRFRTAEQMRAGLLLAVCVRLLAPPPVEPFRLLADPAFRAEIAARVRATREGVKRVRSVPGEVLSSPFITYLAGKPYIVDALNVEQRILAGQLPADAVETRVRAGALVRVEVNPLHTWQADLPE